MLQNQAPHTTNCTQPSIRHGSAHYDIRSNSDSVFNEDNTIDIDASAVDDFLRSDGKFLR
ncbi:hypothetical protein GCM10023156_03500 [Novipirellula rosea]|uniref:Uncharacterized protein n=1 Tax=Novipirellula rosea TaxID=1031540 RepID=A0ABP8M9A6_9BACT